VLDSRLQDYAKLLVEDCVDLQPGWQVLVFGSPHARPLLDEITRLVARRGAYALVRMSYDRDMMPLAWLTEAPVDLVGRIASIEAHALDTADALIAVRAPENTFAGAAVEPARLAALGKGYRPHTERLLRHEVPWVLCQYPTPALAQDAGMSTEDFADFLYGACLLDWKAEAERIGHFAAAFDASSDVRIIGSDTDLRLGLAGRSSRVDAGGANMPGGEFFCCPIEDSAEGVIAFLEFPAVYAGREMPNIRLRFERGQVVDAAAGSNEEFLRQTLDRDEGARRIGELGIGCNPGITRYMRNTAFDEKIDGTIHVALGSGFPDLGGTNVSTLHWDIVKDLRTPGSRIELERGGRTARRRVADLTSK
jgi:aminopeptidase